MSKVLNRAADYITEEYPDAKNQLLNICLLDEPNMTHLNESFVGHKGTTDVITFDFRDEFYDENDEEESAGEIYVCAAVAFERSAEFNNAFESELILYIVHGMLHLFGYNDKTDDDQLDMTSAEQRSMRWLKEYDNLEGIFTYNG